MPVPRRAVASIPCSPASFRTAGERRARSVPPLSLEGAGADSAAAAGTVAPWGGAGAAGTSGWGAADCLAGAAAFPPLPWPVRRLPWPVRLASLAGAAESLAGAEGAAAAPPAVSICPITAPTLTVSPSATAILTSLPSNGEGISALTLSVTTSTSGSSRLTRSPSCFSHLSTVPSVTDSPSCGILIWAKPMRAPPR